MTAAETDIKTSVWFLMVWLNQNGVLVPNTASKATDIPTLSLGPVELKESEKSSYIFVQLIPADMHK